MKGEGHGESEVRDNRRAAQSLAEAGLAAMAARSPFDSLPTELLIGILSQLSWRQQLASWVFGVCRAAGGTLSMPA